MSKRSKIEAVLFDLDDTLAIVSDDFMVDILHQCLRNFANENFNHEALAVIARKVRAYNHSSALLREILKQYIDIVNIEPFWDEVTSLYGANVNHTHVSLLSGASRLIDLLQKSNMQYGIISNTHRYAGTKTLSIIKAAYEIDFFDRTLFLDQRNCRKPSTKAYHLYVDRYSHTTLNERTAYIGNTVGDVQFAINNRLQPFFIAIPHETYSALPKDQRRILDKAVWIKSLDEIIALIN